MKNGFLYHIGKAFRSLGGDGLGDEGRPVIDDAAVRTSGLVSVRGSYFMSLSAVYRAVSVIASSVAQMPLEVYDTDADGYLAPSKSDPVRNWLRRGGDPRMSRYTLVECLVRDMLLHGNGYALIERGADGRPSGLRYLRPQWVTVLSDTFDRVVEYDVAGVGRVRPSEVVHVVNVSEDGITGVSTLDYAANTLAAALSAEATAKGFFDGGGRHSGFITSDRPLNDRQRTAVAERVNKGEPGSVFVLEGGFGFHPMGISAADAQLLESRLYSVSEIARFFGVSPVKLFDLTKSSYSTVEATQLAFLTDTLAPLMAKIEGELERKLYPDDAAKEVNFVTDGLLRADKQSLAAYLQNLVINGVISPNEARKQLGLPPVDGGDTVKMQVNMTNLADIGRQNNDIANGTE